MNIDVFKIFCDLIETKNFSKAAQLNNISQSAVSQQIKNLETDFKVKMIERGKGSLALTYEGKIFYNYSKQILKIYKEIEESLENYSNSIAGEIKIASIYSIGLYDFPCYIKAYFKRCPKVKISLKYNKSALIYSDLIANNIDIGVVAFPKEYLGVDVIPFKNDKLILICNPNNELAVLKEINDISVLNNLSMCSFEKDMPTRKYIDSLFDKGKVKVKIKMDFENIEVIKRMVEIDDSVFSIIPENSIKKEVEKKNLIAIKLPEEFQREIGIIIKKGKKLSKACKNFIDLLQNFDPQNNTILEPCCNHNEEE